MLLADRKMVGETRLNISKFGRRFYCRKESWLWGISHTVGVFIECKIIRKKTLRKKSERNQDGIRRMNTNQSAIKCNGNQVWFPVFDLWRSAIVKFCRSKCGYTLMDSFLTRLELIIVESIDQGLYLISRTMRQEKEAELISKFYNPVDLQN